jgi:hypothetical protein
LAGDVENVWPDKRLAARDHQQASSVHFRDLVDEAEAFLSRQFIRAAARLGRRIQVTVGTLEIAAFCQIESDEERLEVVNRAAVARR